MTDERTNGRTDEQTDLCIELRYAQLKTHHPPKLLAVGCAARLVPGGDGDRDGPDAASCKLHSNSSPATFALVTQLPGGAAVRDCSAVGYAMVI